MSDLFIEGFTVNNEADTLHQQGVALASRAGDLEAANDSFEEAIDVLGYDPKETKDVSVIMQGARINRDRAFTEVRFGLRDDTPDRIAVAYHSLRYGTDNTLGKISFAAEYQYSPEAWSYLQNELGASIGLLGRVATLAFVVGRIENADTEVPEKAIRHYEQADRTIDSNMYYATSNAVNAARHERIFGRKLEAAKWMGRALRYTIEAAKNDRSNLVGSARTIATRAFALSSVKSSRKSVLKKP